MNVPSRVFLRRTLTDASRYYYLDAVQLQAMFGGALTQEAIVERCRRLTTKGLLVKVNGGVRPCWSPTANGIKAVHQPFRPITKTLTYRAKHTTTAADVGIFLALHGCAVWTERELHLDQAYERQIKGMRQHDVQGELRDVMVLPNGNRVPHGDPRQRAAIWKAAWAAPHMPDLRAKFGTTNWAVEVELTPKSNARLSAIMRYYASTQSPYDAVLYFCGTPGVQRQIRRISREIAPTLTVGTYLPATPLYANTLAHWKLIP